MPQAANLIQVEGSTYFEIKKALIDWIDLYTDQLDSDFTIKLLQYEENSFELQIDVLPDNTLFFYLVNYLQYPIGMTYDAEIKGFTTILPFEKLLSFLAGQEVVVYVNMDDEEFDNVHIVNQKNETWRFSFNNKIKQVIAKTSYNSPIAHHRKSENREELKVEKQRVLKKERIKVEKKRALKKKGLSELDSFNKRYPIILAAYFVFMCFYIYYTDQVGTSNFLDALLFGWPFIWVWMEHDIIKNDEVFYKLLTFIIVLVSIGICVPILTKERFVSFFIICTFASLGLLLAIKMLRYLFLNSFKHEAYFLDDWHSRSFKLKTIDALYSLLVFALTGSIAWACLKTCEYAFGFQIFA